MFPTATLASLTDILPLRTRFRQEMNCQITHDSLHRRRGWTLSYLLRLGEATLGYGTVAIAGPWNEKPTVVEFFILREHRALAFRLFEILLEASGARHIEGQTNAELLTIMLHAWCQDIVSEKIVFQDNVVTSLPDNGAHLRRITSEENDRHAFQERNGSSEWVLDFDGKEIGHGGIAFHYNPPYGDIYMEVAEPYRRRGFGAYFVQELKNACYSLGGIPAARCSPENVASRQTILKAGLIPCGHILVGSITSAAAP
jgi:GNAT superfamily N-acetyltransferase